MEGKLLSEMIRLFEQEEPEIKIKLQIVPWEAAHEKLVTGVVGEMTPDISQMGTTWMAELLAMDALQPLDPFLASSTILEEDFFPGSLETNKIGGVWYGLPWYVDTRLFFYRKDLVASAGFPVFPRTWAEFEQFCKRRKVQCPGGFPVTYFIEDSFSFLSILRQQEGDILGDSAPGTIGPPNALAGTLRWMEHLRDADYMPFGNDEWGLDHYEAFTAGSYTSWIGGPWEIWDMEQRLPELKGKWSTARLPRGKNGVSFLGGSNLVMFRSCRDKPAAWRFIEFLLRPENQLVWFQTARGLPSRRRVWDAPLIASNTVLTAFREQLEEARQPPCVPEWEQISDSVTFSLSEFFRGKQTLASTVPLMESRVRSIMEKGAVWQSPLHRGGMLLMVVAGLGLGLAWAFREDIRAIGTSGGWGRILTPAGFLFPALLILTVFRFLPILGSFLSSLTNWNIYGVANPDRIMFVGLDNFRALGEDTRFWQALRNTLLFTAVGVPLNIGIAMCLALMLNRTLEKAQTALRTLFFLPVVATIVVAAIVWGWMFDLEHGPLNRLLTWMGASPVLWLSDTRIALLALVVVAVWKGFGYNLVIFFVSRQNVDETLYENARIDGANDWQMFRFITLPMMRRATTFSAIVTAIGFLQVFTEPYIMTGGGPTDATLSLVLYLYNNGFRFFRVGYASAIAFALFGCSLVLVSLRSRLRRNMEILK